MTIKWWVDDGYVGRTLRTLEIDDSELEGLSARERDAWIDEAVQEEFERQISWGWKVAK